MDKLKAIQTFVTIAREGSLTAASIALETSLPSVVRQLAALEAELNVRLFQRTTRHIKLTDQGQDYFAHCEKLLTELAEREQTLIANQTEPQGRIVMTAPVHFGQQFIAASVSNFLLRYPKVQVELHLLDRVVNLVEEGFDLGVRIDALYDSSLVAQEITKARRVLVATHDYLEKNGEPQNPQELKQHNCLIFANPSNQGWNFQSDGKKFSVAIQGNYIANQIAPLVKACVSGLGIGSFIIYQVAPYLKSDATSKFNLNEKKASGNSTASPSALKIILSDYELPGRPLHLIYPESRLLPARTRLLIDWLKADIQQAAESWSQ